jgi:hypothetical protein
MHTTLSPAHVATPVGAIADRFRISISTTHPTGAVRTVRRAGMRAPNPPPPLPAPSAPGGAATGGSSGFTFAGFVALTAALLLAAQLVTTRLRLAPIFCRSECLFSPLERPG